MPRSRLFLAADPREFHGFLRHCRELKVAELPVNWARSGIFQEKPMLAIANGAGWRRASFGVTGTGLNMVCNIGFCGALDPAMKIGDIFVASHVNGEVIHQPRYSEYAHTGPLISTNRVAQTRAEKESLRATGAFAVEMEAAGALRRARELSLPFYCIRAVSDLSDEDFSCDYNAILREDGRFDLTRLIGTALLRPHVRVPELLRLQRRSSVAARRLGDFLAKCQF